MNDPFLKKQQLLSLQISLGSYESFNHFLIQQALNRKAGYVCIANVHMLVEAHNDPSFAAVVNAATVATPDGKPLTWALRLLHKINQPRVAGMDLLPDLLSDSEKNGIPVYFYGGSEAMLQSTRDYLAVHYPALVLAGAYSPPFRPLTEAEEITVAKRINDSGASLVFVVLGCPKQEKWMARMTNSIQGMLLGVGGALPVLIGMQKRAPKWMQNAGLEWFYRFCQEPRRLFKRYLVTNTTFLYLLAKEKIRPARKKA